MDASLIGWIITALVVFILLSSILIGIKRGLGKTLFRLVWILVTAVIIFFITPIITNALNNIDISFLGIDLGNGTITSISEIGTYLLDSFAEGNTVLAESEALKSLAQALPAMIINTPLFVLLFFLTKWLLWPIWAILASKFFDKQKKAQKKFKKQQKKAQQNGINSDETPIELTVTKRKNSLGGAVVGLVIGLVMCIAIFMPFIGINNIYQNIASIEVTKEDGSKVSLIESQIDDPNTIEYLSSFENSVANKMLTYTGVQFISNSMFSYLTTAPVKEEKISLSAEITNLAKVYNNIATISELQNGDLTQIKLERTLNAIDEILSKIKNSTLITVLGDDIIPLLLNDYLFKEDVNIIDGGDFDKLIKDAYSSYSSNFNIRDLENQLENLIDVLIILNNSNLIVPFINEEVTDLEGAINLIGENVKVSNGFRTIIDNLYEVSMLVNTYPKLVENGVKGLFEALEIKDKYTEQVIDPKTLKLSLETIVINLIDFAKDFATASKNNLDFQDNTRNAFTCIGKVMDVLKDDILEQNNYVQLRNYIIDTVNDLIISSSDFSNENQQDIREITNSISKIDSWEEELRALNTLYSKVIKLINSNSSIEELLSDNSTKLEDLGIGIESAINVDSKIIDKENKNLYLILKILLAKLETTNDETINELLNLKVYSGLSQNTFKDTILSTVHNFSDGGKVNITSEGWVKEFKYNVGIIKKAYKLITGEKTKDDIIKNEDTTLQEIGISVDNAIDNGAKLIFTNATMRAILEHYLTKAKEDGTLSTEFINILSINDNGIEKQILNNIYNPQDSKSKISEGGWEKEFIKIKLVLASDFNSSNLADIGAILDDINGSSIFSKKDVIDVIVFDYIDKEIPSDVAQDLTNGITIMKNNITNNNNLSYEKEFNHIENLLEVILSGYGEGEKYRTEKEKIIAIGNIFNQVTDINQVSGNGSLILTPSVVNSFLKHYFTEYIKNNVSSEEAELKNVINSISDNIQYIKDYAKELNNLLSLIDVVNNNLNDSANLYLIGTELDRIANPIDQSKLINSTSIKKLINYFINKNTSTITNAELITAIETLKLSVTNANTTNISYSKEFEYLHQLTQVISDGTINYETIGNTLDTIRNKNGNGYPSRLISEDSVNDIVLCFFNKQANTYETDYSNIISTMRTKLSNIKNNPQLKYETMFSDLSVVTETFRSLIEIETINDFVTSSASELVGQKLDTMKTMQTICDEEITYNIANEVTNKLLKFAEGNENLTYAINNVINGTKFNFANYTSDDFTCDYITENGADNYYKSFLNELKTEIASAISGT